MRNTRARVKYPEPLRARAARRVAHFTTAPPKLFKAAEGEGEGVSDSARIAARYRTHSHAQKNWARNSRNQRGDDAREAETKRIEAPGRELRE